MINEFTLEDQYQKMGLDKKYRKNEKIADRIMEKIEFYNRFGKLLGMIYNPNKLIEVDDSVEKKDLVSKVEEEIQVAPAEQKQYAKAEIYAPKKAEETKEDFSYQTLRETQKALRKGIKNIKKHLREAKGMKHQTKCFKELDKMLSTIKELD